MAIQRYPLSIHSWPTETEPIRICCARSGEQFASFPLEFVATSGVSSWEFIVTVVVELVRPISGFQPVIRDSNGRMMRGAMPVLAGTYTFEQIGGISVTISSHLSLTAAGSATPAAMARGPEYHRRSIPPSAEGSMSTRSNSSRSTAHQVSTGPDAKAASANAIFETLYLCEAVEISNAPHRQGRHLPGHRKLLDELHSFAYCSLFAA